MTNGILTLRFDATGEIVSCTDAAGAEHAGGGPQPARRVRGPVPVPVRRVGHRPGLPREDVRARSPSARSRTAIDGAAGGAPPGVPRAEGHDPPARHARGGQRRGAVRDRRSTGTRSTGCCAPSSSRRTTATRRCARSSSATSSAPTTERDSGREGAVRDLRAQVDRRAGRRRRIRAAQRQQVRPPRQERPAEPQPAALARRSPTRRPIAAATEFTYAFMPFAAGDLAERDRRGLPAEQPAARRPTAPRSTARSRPTATPSIVETVKPAEDGDGVIAAALREPRTPRPRPRCARPCRTRARSRPTCSKRPLGDAPSTSAASSSGRSRSRRSGWRPEPGSARPRLPECTALRRVDDVAAT